MKLASDFPWASWIHPNPSLPCLCSFQLWFVPHISTLEVCSQTWGSLGVELLKGHFGLKSISDGKLVYPLIILLKHILSPSWRHFIGHQGSPHLVCKVCQVRYQGNHWEFLNLLAAENLIQYTDIKEWCSVPLSVLKCGLSQEWILPLTLTQVAYIAHKSQEIKERNALLYTVCICSLSPKK